EAARTAGHVEAEAETHLLRAQLATRTRDEALAAASFRDALRRFDDAARASRASGDLEAALDLLDRSAFARDRLLDAGRHGPASAPASDPARGDALLAKLYET